MRKRNTFSLEVREWALDMSCGYCQCTPSCTKKADEFHHMMSNTKINIRLYPMFINSIFNCCPISRKCHESPPRIRDAKARAYERYLKSLLT